MSVIVNYVRYTLKKGKHRKEEGKDGGRKGVEGGEEMKEKKGENEKEREREVKWEPPDHTLVSAQAL